MVVNNGLIGKFTPEPIDISEYKDTSNVRIAKAKYVRDVSYEEEPEIEIHCVFKNE